MRCCWCGSGFVVCSEFTWNAYLWIRYMFKKIQNNWETEEIWILSSTQAAMLIPLPSVVCDLWEKGSLANILMICTLLETTQSMRMTFAPTQAHYFFLSFPPLSAWRWIWLWTPESLDLAYWRKIKSRAIGLRCFLIILLCILLWLSS